MTRAEWKQLRRTCARNGLTATAVLASVYAHTLAAWTSSVGDSAQSHVLLNVMHTIRLPVHADIAKVSACFVLMRFRLATM
jgi:non-ribosomal peptide synthetase component F